MTSAELILIAELLRRAADVFVNHGCNDVDLGSLGIVDLERRDIDRLVQAWNWTPNEHNPNDVVAHRVQADWVLMRWLASRVSEERNK